MLVLSRKSSEKIIFRNKTGNFMELVVVEIRGDKVRLAFTAESDITILREEIADAFGMEFHGPDRGEVHPVGGN